MGRHDGNRDIRLIGLVVVQHHFIIHLINMIAGQNQDVIGIVLLHKLKILIDGVCRSGIPVRIPDLLVWRKHRHASDMTVEIPRDPDPDMRVETQRHILCQNPNRVNA